MQHASLTARPRTPLHRAIVLAGLAGALAEVIWIALYCAIAPLSGDTVLRQITASVFPGIAGSTGAPALGLTIHFVLGVAVAYAFSLLIWQTFARRMGKGATLGTAVLALIAIWCVNFFLVLPVVNAEFVGIVPFAVSLTSKVLFGVAMAGALNSLGVKSIPTEARTLAHAQ